MHEDLRAIGATVGKQVGVMRTSFTEDLHHTAQCRFGACARVRSPAPTVRAIATLEHPLLLLLSAVSLPSELVKLAQISAFVKTHSAGTPEAVLRGDAKHRTLNEFQSAHQATFSQATENHPDPAPLPKADYLRQKGFRYAELIQIEYYNKQLKSLLGEAHWNVTKQEKFAQVLKQSLRGPRDQQTSDESSSGTFTLPWQSEGLENNTSLAHLDDAAQPRR